MSNRRNQIFSLILLVGIVVVFLLWFTPMQDRYAAAQDSVTSARSELASLEEAGLTESEEAGEQVEGSEIDARLIESAIPDSFSQDAVIQQLADLAAGYTLAVDSLSFSESESDTQFITEVTVSLNVSGGLFSFLEFLRDLESQNRLYVIDNFNLSIGSETPIQINFAATLKLYHS